MVVGRYMLMGLPKSLPAGFEKSRPDGRNGKGWVGTGAGAAGSSEACFSGVLAPAPWVEGAACGAASWANPEGRPAVSVSIAAASARSLLPALPHCALSRPAPL